MSQHQKQEPSAFDQIDKGVVRTELFFEKYLKQILIGVGVVVLAILAYFGYNKFVAEPAAEKASVALFKAEDRFINGQDSLALQGEGVTAKGLEAIIKEHSGTDAANLAEAYKGIALYDAGKYQEAIDALARFKSEDKYVAPSLKRLIGDAYSELGKYQEAANAYEEAGKLADNDAITPSCLLKAGHAYEKLGNKAKAVELYQSIKEKYYASPEAESVEADIIRASAK